MSHMGKTIRSSYLLLSWETRSTPRRLLQSRVTKDGVHLSLKNYCVIRMVFPKGVSYRGKLQSFMNWKWKRCIYSALIIVPLINYIPHLSRNKNKKVKESERGRWRERGERKGGKWRTVWDLVSISDEKGSVSKGRKEWPYSKMLVESTGVGETENAAKYFQDTKPVHVPGVFINKVHFDSPKDLPILSPSGLPCNCAHSGICSSQSSKPPKWYKVGKEGGGDIPMFRMKEKPRKSSLSVCSHQPRTGV